LIDGEHAAARIAAAGMICRRIFKLQQRAWVGDTKLPQEAHNRRAMNFLPAAQSKNQQNLPCSRRTA
jgi:hypothetical protein